MDGSRFDDLARAVADPLSRRRLVKGLLGGVAGALLGARGADVAAAGCNQAGASCGSRKKCCGGLTCVNDACCPTAQVCGNACCPAGYSCQGGACITGGGSPGGCPAGQGRCNGACTDLTTTANCGACGRACPAPAVANAVATCAGGTCGFACVAGYEMCGGVCVPAGGCCIGGVAVAAGTLNPVDDCQTCQPAMSSATWSTRPDGETCDDGDPCTLTDTCQAGACVGTVFRACPASDQCHDTGTCDRATGACSAPLKPGYCFIGGACVAAGASSPDDACRVCDPDRSTADWSAAEDGTDCDDGDLCTISDTCRGGVCTGGIPFNPCNVSNQCVTGGLCDPATGACVGETPKPDGVECSRVVTGVCNVGGACQAGQCTPVPKDCSAVADQCNDAACDPSTGSCYRVPKRDLTGCVARDECGTRGGFCEQGVCSPGRPFCVAPPPSRKPALSAIAAPPSRTGARTPAARRCGRRMEPPVGRT